MQAGRLAAIRFHNKTGEAMLPPKASYSRLLEMGSAARKKEMPEAIHIVVCF